MVDHFSIIEDPRMDRCKKHELLPILVMTMCSVICNCDTWSEIELFCKERIDWFKKFFDLPNGVPSHDTFARVFSLINPDQFQLAFISWVSSFHRNASGEIINIDGKTLRGTGNKKTAIQMVSAWAVEANIVLGQIKTKEGSNEITAIPELLSMLEVNNCIVTIDAIGCQTSITKEITERGGDYVLALKGNQPYLKNKVENIFKEKLDFDKSIASIWETTELNRGRFESRRYICLPRKTFDHLDIFNKWTNFNSIGMVESVREEKGKVASETRFYISSLKPKAQNFAKAVRGHWHIENKLHWCLDVSFNRDNAFEVSKGM
jgi:predicted transposase YbfD/YdcC